MLDRLPQDVLVVALSRVPFASHGAVDATSRRVREALRSSAFTAERTRSGFSESRLVVAFGGVRDDDDEESRIIWRSFTMRHGAPVRVARLPHVRADIMDDRERPPSIILLDKSPRKVAFSHGATISIVDLASGRETVLPSLGALHSRYGMEYSWAGHAAGEWLVGGGLGAGTGEFSRFSTNTWRLEGLTGSWTAGPVMPTASSGGVTVSVGGAAYVIGGYAGRNRINPDLLRYERGSWTRMASPPVGGEHLFATVLNGRIHVLSTADHLLDPPEMDSNPHATRHHVYDLLQDTWSTNVLPDRFNLMHTYTYSSDLLRAALTACEQDGRLVFLMVEGGYLDSEGGHGLDVTFEVYEEATETWQSSLYKLPDFKGRGVNAAWTINLG